MNTARVIGICHRIKITRADKRGPLLAELTDAIDQADGAPGLTVKQLDRQAHNSLLVENLRGMLTSGELDGSPGARMKLARQLRKLQQ